MPKYVIASTKVKVTTAAKVASGFCLDVASDQKQGKKWRVRPRLFCSKIFSIGKMFLGENIFCWERFFSEKNNGIFKCLFAILKMV